VFTDAGWRGQGVAVEEYESSARKTVANQGSDGIISNLGEAFLPLIRSANISDCDSEFRRQTTQQVLNLRIDDIAGYRDRVGPAILKRDTDEAQLEMSRRVRRNNEMNCFIRIG